MVQDRERERKAGDIFEKFQDIAGSRPGDEGEEGWEFTGASWEPAWPVDGCSPTWDHPTDLRFFMCFWERKCQVLLK